MAQATNALYDARITSESAPLTRVTDIDTDFPDSANINDLPVQCTTTNGNTVYISYDELDNENVWSHLVALADGVDATLDDINTAIGAAKTYIDGLTAPYTAAEYYHAVSLLRAPALNPIKGI